MVRGVVFSCSAFAAVTSQTPAAATHTYNKAPLRKSSIEKNNRNMVKMHKLFCQSSPSPQCPFFTKNALKSWTTPSFCCCFLLSISPSFLLHN